MSQFNMAVVALPLVDGISADDSLPDGALLERFVLERDAQAFETLIRRHAPRVLRICRQRLSEVQDAEDACQATFLVLVNRAAEIRQSDSVSAWLNSVARRVAIRAKIQADRRRRRELSVDIDSVSHDDEPSLNDARSSLRAEVSRLPEKYRRPVELCYWEGLSSEQAAARLECPTGTLKWRLSRAREILRSRLARAGLALLLLFMRRNPRANAALVTPYSPGRTALVTFDRGTSNASGLTAEFVRDTISMATFVRDFPLKSRLVNAWVPTSNLKRFQSIAIISTAVILAIILSFFVLVRSSRSNPATASITSNGSVSQPSCH
jgi:RNA polymerase sigma factor (sigma-70 family)